MSDELDAILAIAADDTDDTVLLRATSRTVILMALDLLPQSPEEWINSENPLDEVTQADFDQLQAIVDNAATDVMTAV